MKGVFREVRASIARLLGRRVPAKGTGRRHVSVQEYIAYPPSIALAKAEYEEILEAAEKVMLYYQGYKAVAVGCRTEQDIILRARTVNPRQSMRDQLPCRHLWVLNNRGTIVFAPIIEGASNVRVLYLHDVPESRLRQMPRGSLIVQTDKHRFDAHLHIPPSMKPTEIDGWQEILSALNGSSRSAVAQDYYRPLPGFRGEHSFRAAIRDDIVAEGTFRFDLLRAKVKEQRELQAQAASRVAYQGSPRWGHFSHPDRSVTDMAYAVHLLQRGYDEDEVSDVLIAESEDIALRADGDLRGYLARIIRGAHREHSRVLTTLKERAACI
jgi:hypothetical protein